MFSNDTRSSTELTVFGYWSLRFPNLDCNFLKSHIHRLIAMNGIGLTSLQGPHRMRGIAHTVINFINNVPLKEKCEHTFTFYLYPEAKEAALNLLNLDNFSYEIIEIKHPRRISKQPLGKLRFLINVVNEFFELRDLYFGDSRI